MPSKAELYEALRQVNLIAEENSRYLSLFPATGLCVHTLGLILNVTTPILAEPAVPPIQTNPNQLPLL